MKYKALTLWPEAVDAILSGARLNVMRPWLTDYRGDVLICRQVTSHMRAHACAVAELYAVTPVFGGAAYAFRFRNVRRLYPAAVEEGRLLYETPCDVRLAAEGDRAGIAEALRGLVWKKPPKEKKRSIFREHAKSTATAPSLREGSVKDGEAGNSDVLGGQG